MTTTNYRITSPAPRFSGTVADVVFHDGVATLAVDRDAPRVDGATNLPKAQAALAYFRRKGYGVQEIEAAPDLPQAEAAGTPNTRAVDHPAAVGHVDGGTGDQVARQIIEQVEPVEPPKKSASKSDWVDHAVKHGMSREDADGMTRDELAAKYLEEAK